MSNYYIGIDLGGTRVKIGLVAGGKGEAHAGTAPAGSVIARKIIQADAAGGLEASFPVIQKEIDDLLQAYHVTRAALGGIGLAFPGLVDPSSRRILSTNKKYDDALAVDVPGWVRQHWDVPFFMENDARMAAVGEWKYGAGRDTNDLVVMTIGTGIGTSAIIEGKLLRGRHFQAGCLGGHISVQYEGRECTCGNKGCLEAYGSTWSLKGRVKDFETLFAMAEGGDESALRIRQDCFDVWATGIVNLIHAYDPEVVVLGGGVMMQSDKILPYLTEKVHAHAWTPWGKVQLRATQLHSDAGIAGVVHCLQFNK
ncbi:MAG TPA: ROK family protein [Puia sp.]|jgi:glucokinase|nr:ROK family protein [Puia sp.]